jgi:hypothetical protein
MIAEPVPVPHRRKPRTHGRESTIDGFNKSRIVLEMCAPLAARHGTNRRHGTTQLNGTKNFHASMCYNGGPVMTENEDGQNVSQNYVDDHPYRERDKGFDTGIG